MKKLFSLVAMTLVAAGVSANPIDEAKAKRVAQEFIVPGHTMQLVYRAERQDSEAAAKLSAATLNSTPYYVFSRGEDKGYVIVAGDNCMPLILGYTESGNFDENDIAPALKDMLGDWAKSIERAQATGTNINNVQNNDVARLANYRVDIAPLTTSHWHQTGPYNDYAPLRVDNGAKSMTGCVATAISQILYYWRKDLPSTLQSTTPTYPHDGYSHADVTLSFPKGSPLRWDLMLDKYGSEPAPYKEAVAMMVYSVGTASHLEYSIEGGTATSGHIEDIPAAISNFFGMNGGWVAYRSSYTQEDWTQLIYNELAKGRPVMYTGVHPTSGGHAVYIDGYQRSNNLMHFNFGWGGQSDGYYTTTLETGMNGFNDYQSALINAYPKKWNIQAEIKTPKQIYRNLDNEFTIKISNKSTLPLNGVYLFVTSNSTNPTKLNDASSVYEDVIGKDESVQMKLTGKPTSATSYAILTDENLSVLTKVKMETVLADADLQFCGLKVMSTTDKENIDGQDYVKIYNNKASLVVNVLNRGTVDFGGSAYLTLYSSTDNGATWSSRNLSKSSVVVSAGTSANVSLSASSLTANTLYKAVLNPSWGTRDKGVTLDTTGAVDTVAYFVVTGSNDLQATLTDGVLKFSGHWDATQYTTLCESARNKTAKSYDITECESVFDVPDAIYPNPNALVYAPAIAKGNNVVCKGAGDSDLGSHISIKAGSPFVPQRDIIVESATVDLNQNPNRFYMFTAPFDCKLPDGIVAREFVELHGNRSNGLNEKDIYVTELEAGKNYFVLTTSEHRMVLQALPDVQGNVRIVSKAKTNEADPAFIGTFDNCILPQGSRIITLTNDVKDFGDQYLDVAPEGTEVEGLRGYFYDSEMAASSVKFTVVNGLINKSYLNLGYKIAEMYETYAMYHDVVGDAANILMMDSIAAAEHLVTNRTLETAVLVNTYIKNLSSFIEEYKTMTSDDEEKEVTALIENASFEKNNTTGWTLGTMEGYTAVGGVYVGTSNNMYRGVGLDGKYLFQSLVAAADSSSVGISQTVMGLAPGYYRLTAKVGSDTGNDIVVFAGDSTTTIKADIFGSLYLHDAIIKDVLVTATEGQDTGSLIIGVKAGKWYKADDFRLFYIGTHKEGEETAINEVKPAAQMQSTHFYNIAGQRVANIREPGIYILNGKKYLIK